MPSSVGFAMHSLSTSSRVGCPNHNNAKQVYSLYKVAMQRSRDLGEPGKSGAEESSSAKALSYELIST
jgi:hypothetical protein